MEKEIVLEAPKLGKVYWIKGALAPVGLEVTEVKGGRAIARNGDIFIRLKRKKSDWVYEGFMDMEGEVNLIFLPSPFHAEESLKS